MVRAENQGSTLRVSSHMLTGLAPVLRLLGTLVGTARGRVGFERLHMFDSVIEPDLLHL